ncbi:hypothetical protein CGCA056_v015070 [Colletotrichum aenigma]|uniref:uncharacterized protein n=1 Tax=Colletotrichum aenigma TaxID=1215731 RepID=UPI001872BDF0|nr:uncharacterized protein CGCA056_v015070 [Colletotrichum aenigma]KAF5483172.1 hypothetical protein CGCA056_v015070 [Colletotrichum aenigma]
MSLPEPKDVEEATQVLQSIIPLLPQRPIKISLLGLGTFPGIDPGRAEILFAHPRVSTTTSTRYAKESGMCSRMLVSSTREASAYSFTPPS